MKNFASVEDMKYYMHIMPNLFKAWSNKIGWQHVVTRINFSSADQDDMKLLEKTFSSFDFNIDEIDKVGIDKMVERIKAGRITDRTKLTESQLRRIIREELEDLKYSQDPLSNNELQKILDDHRLWIASKMKHGKRADLQGANLQGADLYGANLRSANLQGANLEGAYLFGANLQYANLQDSNLVLAILEKANLREANLRGANLRNADLKDADLFGTDFQDSDLQDADFSGADFRRSNLQRANVQGANFYGVDLRGSLGVNLRGTKEVG